MANQDNQDRRGKWAQLVQKGNWDSLDKKEKRVNVEIIHTGVNKDRQGSQGHLAHQVSQGLQDHLDQLEKQGNRGSRARMERACQDHLDQRESLEFMDPMAERVRKENLVMLGLLEHLDRRETREILAMHLEEEEGNLDHQDYLGLQD